ncbi:hypothetical protein ACFFRR_008382 [Megaselia abdita]
MTVQSHFYFTELFLFLRKVFAAMRGDREAPKICKDLRVKLEETGNKEGAKQGPIAQRRPADDLRHVLSKHRPITRPKRYNDHMMKEKRLERRLSLLSLFQFPMSELFLNDFFE